MNSEIDDRKSDNFGWGSVFLFKNVLNIYI